MENIFSIIMAMEVVESLLLMVQLLSVSNPSPLLLILIILSIVLSSGQGLFHCWQPYSLARMATLLHFMHKDFQNLDKPTLIKNLQVKLIKVFGYLSGTTWQIELDTSCSAIFPTLIINNAWKLKDINHSKLQQFTKKMQPSNNLNKEYLDFFIMVIKTQLFHSEMEHLKTILDLRQLKSTQNSSLKNLGYKLQSEEWNLSNKSSTPKNKSWVSLKNSFLTARDLAQRKYLMTIIWLEIWKIWSYSRMLTISTTRSVQI